MSTSLNAIAIDVVGQYTQAAHHLVDTCRAGAGRSLGGRAAEVIARASDRADDVIDRAANRATEGIQAFGAKSAWASDLMVVNALRTINLPVAKLSFELASQVNHASSRLAKRVAGVKAEARASGTATATTRKAKTAVKRTRRAAANA